MSAAAAFLIAWPYTASQGFSHWISNVEAQTWLNLIITVTVIPAGISVLYLGIALIGRTVEWVWTRSFQFGIRGVMALTLWTAMALGWWNLYGWESRGLEKDANLMAAMDTHIESLRKSSGMRETMYALQYLGSEIMPKQLLWWPLYLGLKPPLDDDQIILRRLGIHEGPWTEEELERLYGNIKDQNPDLYHGKNRFLRGGRLHNFYLTIQDEERKDPRALLLRFVDEYMVPAEEIRAAEAPAERAAIVDAFARYRNYGARWALFVPRHAGLIALWNLGAAMLLAKSVQKERERAGQEPRRQFGKGAGWKRRSGQVGINPLLWMAGASAIVILTGLIEWATPIGWFKLIGEILVPLFFFTALFGGFVGLAFVSMGWHALRYIISRKGLPPVQFTTAWLMALTLWLSVGLGAWRFFSGEARKLSAEGTAAAVKDVDTWYRYLEREESFGMRCLFLASLWMASGIFVVKGTGAPPNKTP